MHGDHTTKYQTDMPVQDLRETLSRLAPRVLSSRFAPPTREKEEVHSSIRPPFTSVPLTQPVRLPPIVVEVTKRLLKVLQHNCIPRSPPREHRRVVLVLHRSRPRNHPSPRSPTKIARQTKARGERSDPISDEKRMPLR
nr:hypothetical protein Iba_scaffold37877CG0010 [Ipomoea batatas]GMD31330.1 hypothetical protein Iba_chr09aCG15450 [Ipomoea batatas]